MSQDKCKQRLAEVEDESANIIMRLQAELTKEREAIRPEVRWFSQQMESILKRNDHKGGWGPDKCSMNYLMERLQDKVGRTNYSTGLMGGKEVRDKIIHECTNVANFAMMIADRMERFEEGNEPNG